jgi:hypothetical protein
MHPALDLLRKSTVVERRTTWCEDRGRPYGLPHLDREDLRNGARRGDFVVANAHRNPTTATALAIRRGASGAMDPSIHGEQKPRDAAWFANDFTTLRSSQAVPAPPHPTIHPTKRFEVSSNRPGGISGSGQRGCGKRPPNRYHRAMPDDVPLPDPRDDEFYARYLVTCAAPGVEPVLLERARELIGEWTRAIAVATMYMRLGCAESIGLSARPWAQAPVSTIQGLRQIIDRLSAYCTAGLSPSLP